MSRAAPLVPRAAWWAGLVTILVVGALVVFTAARHGEDPFFAADDSRFYRAAAEDPFGDGATFAAIGRPEEAAYRYGRILLPFLAWVAAGGRDPLVPWTLVLVNVLAIGAVVTLAGALLESAGIPPVLGVLVLRVPGLALLTTHIYAEPLALALVLLAYLLASRGRPRGALAGAAAAILARETAVLALLPLAWRAARAGRGRSAAAWLLALVPAFAWYGWVRGRIGEVPLLASVPTRAGALRLPFVGLVGYLRDGFGPGATLTVGLCAATAVAGVLVWRIASWSPVGGGAAILGLFALCLGPNALAYGADTLRLLASAHALIVLALTAAAFRTGPARGAMRPGDPVGAPGRAT